MVELSLDFDDENLDKFEPALNKLQRMYGDAVRVRRSARRGWHIWVKGVDIRPDEELELREELGDCKGRTQGDYARLRCGFKTSRLFTAKASLIKGCKEVHEAGEWLTYDEWKEAYGKVKGVRNKAKEGEEEDTAQAKKGRTRVPVR